MIGLFKIIKSYIKKEFLQEIIKESGIKALEIAFKSKSGHLGGSLSLIQALSYYLYNLKKNSSNWKIILSKGHSSLGLYSLLETLKIEDNLTNRYCLIPGGFHGHTCSKASKLILASTGSLGHGLPIAAGHAYAAKKNNYDLKTICIIGDGDMQEGSNLEILHSLLKLKDCNLKIINDDNSSVDSKFVNSSNFFLNLKKNYIGLDIIKSFEMEFWSEQKNFLKWISMPGLKIANCKTIKGFGFKEMYNNPKWHAGIPTYEEYKKFLAAANFNLKDEK